MTMTLETSKKVLNIASVYNFVVAGLAFAFGIMVLAGVGVTAVPLKVLAGGSAILLLGGAADMIMGVCSRNAAKDPAKVVPVLYFSIIMMAVQVSSLIFNIAEGKSILVNLICLAITATVFSAANSIKKAAGFCF